MQVPFVDLKAQYAAIGVEIRAAMEAVIADTAFIGGKYAKQFEEDFARFCGTAYCVGVGNGTDALFLVLKALAVGAGDEVIVPANSFIASSEAVTMTGAKVVFVDVDPVSYNIDLNGLEAALTPKTKVVMPVHLYGQMADIGSIRDIVAGRGIHIVEDAAQAHGASFNGIGPGTTTEAACFSFYPGKNLGAYGDAGAIVTMDEGLAKRARMIANHGRISKYDHEFEGVNSRLDGLQGAILSTKLRYLEDWTESRRKAASLYKDALASTGIPLPVEGNSTRHVYHLFVVRVANREVIQARLKEKGIASGVHYPVALPNLSAYKYLGHGPEDFPKANQFAKEVMSLPIFPEITSEQIAYVAEELTVAVMELGGRIS